MAFAESVEKNGSKYIVCCYEEKTRQRKVLCIFFRGENVNGIFTLEENPPLDRSHIVTNKVCDQTSEC